MIHTMKTLLSALVVLAGCVTFCPPRHFVNLNLNLPASASNVWQITVARGSGSACPVTDLSDGTFLFLTAKHITQGWVDGEATGAVVEDREGHRKLVVLSAVRHKTEDIAILKVKGDGKRLGVFSLDFVGGKLGDRIYTVGYPGPAKQWFSYSGYLGGENSTSSHVELGMSGGALLNLAGKLSGILRAHGYSALSDQHFPEQSYFIPLQELGKWLRSNHVIA